MFGCEESIGWRIGAEPISAAGWRRGGSNNPQAGCGSEADMGTVWWIRHGESEANAGMACADAWSTPLTMEGRRQAERVAEVVVGAGGAEPGLVVHSAMLRSRQTAAALLAKRPHLRTEEWPVEEFTFLSGARYQGTTQDQRAAGVREYWDRMDPDRCDGPGAESFAGFMRRVDGVLERLGATASEGGGPTLVYTHGRFIRGVLLRVREMPGEQRTVALMRRARAMLHEVIVPNCAIWRMTRTACGWSIGCAEVGHLLHEVAVPAAGRGAGHLSTSSPS